MRLRIPGVGPQLLLLHGPQTQAMGHAVAERLSGEFTIVASDLPGYGGSAPTASCSNREMAAALVEVWPTWASSGDRWSEADKEWQSPCHGSRFTAVGELLQGPATTGLARQGSLSRGPAPRADAHGRFRAATTGYDHLVAAALHIYLQDHLAGATFGLELVQRCHRNNKGTEFAEPLAKLTVEIAEDRRTLRRVMHDVGADVSRTKVAAGWTLEKIRRLKPNGVLVGYTPLARVVELESLVIGIAGKRAMWQALDEVAASEDRRLDHHDFSRLAERANDQLSRVEALRLHAAWTAFLRPSPQRRARASA